MNRKFAVIGVGNMAKSILAGIISSDIGVTDIFLYDKNQEQYQQLPEGNCVYHYARNIAHAVSEADCVLLSVKPQNFNDVLDEIKEADRYDKKLYISIAAGITAQSISATLNGACVVRVLPNLPMTIGFGVSLICQNDCVSDEDMQFVQAVFSSAGSILMIQEEEMNRMIGVTSSSPAYVFQFVDAIYRGALAQGLSKEGLIDVICDVLIGSATLLKQTKEIPSELVTKVASKGGTTECALRVLNDADFYQIIQNAMIACTTRADELGNVK